MRAKSWVRIFFVLWTCGAVTATTYTLDQRRMLAKSSAQNLKLSQQIFTQVENLTRAGTLANMEEPLTWAVQYLAQGTEPRFFLIRPLFDSPHPENERSSFNEKDEFVFSKRVAGLKNPGWVEIKIGSEPRYFLGITHKFVADLALIAFALIVGYLFYRLSFYGIPETAIKMQTSAPEPTMTPTSYESLPPSTIPTAWIHQLKVAKQGQYDIEISALQLALDAFKSTSDSAPEIQRAKSIFESARKTRLSLIQIANSDPSPTSVSNLTAQN